MRSLQQVILLIRILVLGLKETSTANRRARRPQSKAGGVSNRLRISHLLLACDDRAAKRPEHRQERELCFYPIDTTFVDETKETNGRCRANNVSFRFRERRFIERVSVSIKYCEDLAPGGRHSFIQPLTPARARAVVDCARLPLAQTSTREQLRTYAHLVISVKVLGSFGKPQLISS
jgi:hypothetical protein